MELNEVIRELLAEGRSIRTLARELDVSPSSVQDWKTGRCPVSAEGVIRLLVHHPELVKATLEREAARARAEVAS